MPANSLPRSHLSATNGRIVAYCCLGLVFLKGFGSDVLVGAPLNRLIELMICRGFYMAHEPGKIDADGNVDQSLCKVPEVQTKLAFIMGITGFFSSLAELVVSVPIGHYADKIGQVPMLLLNLFSGLLYYGWVVVCCAFYDKFSPRDIIFCAAFYLVGGGPRIFTNLVFALIANTNTPELRTRWFYHLEFLVQAVQLISPIVGSALLSLGLWPPFYVGFASQVAQALIFPELIKQVVRSSTRSSLDQNQRSQAASVAGPAGSGDESAETAHLLPSAEASERENTEGKRTPTPRFYIAQLIGSVTRLNFDRETACIMAAFLLTNVSRGFVGIILQYASFRYSLSFAQAGYLLSVKALVSIMLFLAILPTTNLCLAGRYGMSSEMANLTVAQVSICLLASGCIVIGLAPDVGVAIVGLVVVSLGLGFGIAMQSFATTLVSKEHIAKLYAGISVFETLGSLLSHPIMAASLAAGINMRGIPTGLPFYLCALLYGVAAVPVWIVRIRHLKQDKHSHGNRQTGECGATTGR